MNDPQMVQVGKIGINEFGLWLGGTWQLAGEEPNGWLKQTGLNQLMGHSIERLHQMSHGLNCGCPVYGYNLPWGGGYELLYREVPDYEPEPA